jgi:sterol desaturase/sphingolipid hydroxylase (fatty acid hydroxylase superfamily)
LEREVIAMFPDIIAIAIPFLLALVVMEFVVDRMKPIQVYHFGATVSNIGCGIFEQLTGFISKGLLLALYTYVYEACRITTVPLDSAIGWVALLALVDLNHYFFHSACHRYNILWAAHVVHHEVQEYNLTVALRRSVLQEFLVIPVCLPFAVAGFHPAAFLLIFAAQNLYQFWVHLTHSPEFRWLGWLFVTPYHHAVHHCRNTPYLDKNFGGVFIIWDKLFGTFEPLRSAPDFGINQKTLTFNPVKAQLTTMSRLFRRMLQQPTLLKQWQFLWASPTWLAEDEDSPIGARWTMERYNPTILRNHLRWAVLLFAICTVGVILFRDFENVLDEPVRYSILLVLGTVLYTLGSMLDGKPSKSQDVAHRSDLVET